jgi:2-polyprenyl-6-methoxyphenol hydroxylase-like FAD-dependent oxidoreductase
MPTAATPPVAVVGAGPVGLALALLLDHHGVSCTVYSDARAAWSHPRGNTHNARTMEHYRRLGIAAEVRELGLPPDHPTDVAYFTRYNGHELARLAMPSRLGKLQAVAESPQTDQTPEPLHRANQMYVEALLLDRARSRRGVTIELGWRVDELQQDPEGVTLCARRLADGTSERIRARYVVGADGGRSIVRRSIGSRLQGHDRIDGPILGGQAAAIHLRLPTFHRDVMAHRKAWSYWALNHEVATNLIALDGGDEFSLLTSSVDPDDLDEAALTDLVHRAAGAAIPVQILGHRPWTPGVALVADRFAEGRVFLAGDAAHLFTPTGGFGMNTGIDDAANLAWKLAATIQGWGRPRLLASYETERRPIAARNTGAARALNQKLRDIERPVDLDRDSGDGARMRRRLGDLLSTYGEQFASIGVQLGGRYDGSPIVATAESPPSDALTAYTPSSVPGGRAPHLWLNGRRDVGASLYDRLGRGFTMLRLGSQPPRVERLQHAADAAGVPLKVLNVADPVARELYERDLVLIRPDQHVAWRGNHLAADATALVTQITGGG